MGVTASMYLRRGYYTKEEHSNSGWQLLGDKTVVSGEGQYDGWTWATLPAQPTTATFVWSKMPEDFVLELPDDQDNSALVEAWDGVTTNVRLTGRKLWKDGDWNTICLPFLLGAYEIYTYFGYPEIRALETIYSYDASGDPYYGPRPGDDEYDEYIADLADDPTAPNPADYTFRTGFDDATGTLRLYFNWSDDIYPGTPYLIKWDNDTEHPYIESPTFTGVTIDTSSDDALVSKTVTSEDGKVSFLGNYGSTTFTSTDRSILFLGTDNTLYYPESGAHIGPFRAYFQVNLGSQEVKQFVLNFGDVTDRIESLSPNPSPVREGSADVWYDLNGRKLSGKPAQRGIYIYKGKKVVIK